MGQEKQASMANSEVKEGFRRGKKVDKVEIHFDDGSVEELHEVLIAELAVITPEVKPRVKLHFAGLDDAKVVALVYGVLDFATKVGLLRPPRSPIPPAKKKIITLH